MSSTINKSDRERNSVHHDGTPVSATPASTDPATPSKVCSRCRLTKPLGAYYTKGTRTDAKCKDCVKAGKRKIRDAKAVGQHGERFQQMAAIVEAWELARLKELTAKLKEINDRCEHRLKNPP